MQFADPIDHSFNYDRRFVDHNSFMYPKQPLSSDISRSKYSLLPKVKPLTVEDEDELITVFKEFLSHDRELEAAKVQLAH